MTVRCGEDAFAAGFGGYRVTQILRADEAGARLFLDGSDADLDGAGSFVPLHAPDGGASIGAGGDDFAPQAGAERAGCAFIGQAKADGGHVHGLAGFVGYEDREAPCGARTGAIDHAFAFDDFELHDNSGVSGDNECQSAAENAAGGGYYSEFHVLYVGWGRGYSLVVGCWFLVVSGGGRWHAASGFFQSFKIEAKGPRVA